MKLEGKICVVTGAARGIGRALCERFAAEGAIVIGADREAGPGLAKADVSREADIAALIETTLRHHGRIDLFVSNAGIVAGGGPEAPDSEWQKSWEINLMAHVWAARHTLPGMLARKEGYLLSVASAAGLLTSIGSAPYAVTKHGAVAFAEWLAITYGDQGIRVSCLCPQGVKTGMFASVASDPGGKAILAAGALIEPAAVADAVVHGLEAERFLILPHPEVATYEVHRAKDHDRWLAGMRKIQREVS